MIPAIDALPVVVHVLDGNLSTVPLGNLCCVCVERAKQAGDHLCAECRAAYWYWARWTGENKERAGD